MSYSELTAPVIMEARLAASGYTVSIAHKAVLGRFRDSYFMRSGDCHVTLPAEETSLEQLIDRWNDFRRQAVLGNLPPARVHRLSTDRVARRRPEGGDAPVLTSLRPSSSI
jgi:hypothetical protein